jgi:signal transduction histidine kinase
LIDNAIRHSPVHGTVRISGRARKSGVAIEVADEGPGIPPGESARVFERFYRVDAARASGDGGTGLGLSIVRGIVDLHGGAIEVLDREPSGCRMVVMLPGG